MIRVFGPALAIAGFGLAGISGCSGTSNDTTTKPLGNAGSGGSDGGGSSNGGTAGTEPNCAACASGYCLPGGECVECLPDPDTCQSGHCGGTYTCVPGCSVGDSCASGQCAGGDCVNCIDDSECSAGRVCGNGVCADPCSGEGDCSLACCAEHCVDTTRDIDHCGGCGIACGADEFCGSYGCVTATLLNLCNTSKMAVVLNGIDSDNAAAAKMRGAIEANCNPVPAMRTESQATTNLFNPATGQPVAGGGELLLLAGGPFGHKHVAYLEDNGITPIHSRLADGNMLEFRESGSNNVVVSAPFASATDSHDFFVIQIARDPETGTTTAMAYGFFDPGTRAAAWYFANELMPTFNAFSASWYVFEWTDMDGDEAPTLSEITAVDAG